MKAKEDKFKTWIHWVWSYNEYYEEPLKHYPLLDDTETSIDLLEAYCRIIVTEGKRRQKNHIKDNYSYENYHPNVQNAIQNIIGLLSDGRDLHLTKDVSDLNMPIKKFDHHLDNNGKLPFENDPFDKARYILGDIPEVKEIIQSEKKTANFKQFCDGNWYLFEGYESGSASVRFDNINCNNKGTYTFDGDIIWYATVDSKFDGDGVVIQTECEDVSFDKLPYISDKWETAEEFVECIKRCKKETTEELKDSIRNCFEEYYLNEL